MSTKNAIWSYCLLLVYALVFGHQVVPHHHHDLNNFHNHHASGELDHCISEKETHQHISHQEHFDEGILDYIACLIGQAEHNPLTDCECEVVFDNRFSTDQNTKTVSHDTLLSGVYATEVLADSQRVNSPDFEVEVSEKRIEHGINRGPPSIYI